MQSTVGAVLTGKTYLTVKYLVPQLPECKVLWGQCYDWVNVTIKPLYLNAKYDGGSVMTGIT